MRSSGAKLTWKSRLKSLVDDDTQRNFQPMRSRKRAMSASGARETATNETLRCARCTVMPSVWSAMDQQLAPAFEQLGERAPAFGRFEDVVLGDVLPGQGAALAGDLVAEAHELLLARQQRPK